GEEEVEDDDGQEAGDEAFGAGAADAGGAAGAGEALVATDQPDGAAEEEALADALEDLPVVDSLGGVLPVGLVGDAEEFGGDDPPAQHAEQVAVDGQDGQQQQADDDARDDEVADRVGAHDAQSVELFGDVHGAQLGGERAADASGEHDRRQHRADLLDHRQPDHAADALFLA